MMSGPSENVLMCKQLSSPFLKCVCLNCVARYLLHSMQLVYTRDDFKRLSDDLVNRACLMPEGCQDTCLLMSEMEFQDHVAQLIALVQNNCSHGEKRIFLLYRTALQQQTWLTPKYANLFRDMLTAFYRDEVVISTDDIVSLSSPDGIHEVNVHRNMSQSINKIKKAAEVLKSWLRPWFSEWMPDVNPDKEYEIINEFENIVERHVRQMKEAGEKYIRLIRIASNNWIGKEGAAREMNAKEEACTEGLDELTKQATDTMEEYTKRHIPTNHIVSKIMIAVNT